jgi:hypothetical protein
VRRGRDGAARRVAHAPAAAQRLVFLIAATLLLDAVASVLMYLFEHDDPRSGFDDLGGALFWVSAQLTTVSSQMPNPVTTAGRALDLVLEVWAISVVATLAASLAAFFRARHVEEMPAADKPASSGRPSDGADGTMSA